MDIAIRLKSDGSECNTNSFAAELNTASQCNGYVMRRHLFLHRIDSVPIWNALQPNRRLDKVRIKHAENRAHRLRLSIDTLTGIVHCDWSSIGPRSLQFSVFVDCERFKVILPNAQRNLVSHPIFLIQMHLNAEDRPIKWNKTATRRNSQRNHFNAARRSSKR